jgi:ferredoxin-NADP reductase
MKASLLRTHHENIAKNVVSFWFEAESPIDQLAGQYVEMTIHHDHPDSRGEKRWFTLSSSPTDIPQISITTKFSSEHGSSFKQALRALRPGDNVHISEPMGDFVLPKDDKIPLVFVAGGIGITPFHSIIKYLYDTKQERDITFIYAVSNEHEMVFQDLFMRYGMQRIIVLDKPDSAWDGEIGRLSGQRIVNLAQPSIEALVYISGSETLQKELITEGVTKQQLVGDFFPGYSTDNLMAIVHNC